MPTSKSRCVFYIRVSTAEQSVENQIPELEREAERRGLEVVQVYRETASAASGKRRIEFARMMRDARRQRFDVVMVWSLSRFGRKVREIYESLWALSDCGVAMVSVKEPELGDLSGVPGQVMLSALALAADIEGRQKSERVKAGMDRAKREGRRVGRPKKHVDNAEVLVMRQRGMTLGAIGKHFGVSSRTVSRVLMADPVASPKGAKGSPKSASEPPGNPAFEGPQIESREGQNAPLSPVIPITKRGA